MSIEQGDNPTRSSMKRVSLAFVSSAFNEEENLEELHRRCRAVHAELQREFDGHFDLRFNMVIADNGSTDGTLRVLKRLQRRDCAVVALANQTNYGAEASVSNLIDHAHVYDLVVLLCSDLQDPPEIAGGMVHTLLTRPELDAVLGLKKRSAGGPLLRLARRSYYRALDLSSRKQMVPNGYHGFGCYRREVLKEATRIWNGSDMNVRQCLTNACLAPLAMDYVQEDRLRGESSYQKWGYWREALRALLSSDAAASRLAITIGCTGLGMAGLVALMLLGNVLRGRSGYGGGVPTLMGLMLISFAVQMLMFGVLSRQIEALRAGGIRQKVRFKLVSTDYS
jgi:glycosyltransferase involved in cell wall biosynthesis